jgi:hypothetical protein
MAADQFEISVVTPTLMPVSDRRSPCHITSMAQGKTYTVMRQKDATYAVEIIEPSSVPRVVGDFITEQEAESWIVEQKAKKPLDIENKRGNG